MSSCFESGVITQSMGQVKIFAVSSLPGNDESYKNKQQVNNGRYAQKDEKYFRYFHHRIRFQG
jgi:hypothetical protein